MKVTERMDVNGKEELVTRELSYEECSAVAQDKYGKYLIAKGRLHGWELSILQDEFRLEELRRGRLK